MIVYIFETSLLKCNRKKKQKDSLKTKLARIDKCIISIFESNTKVSKIITLFRSTK